MHKYVGHPYKCGVLKAEGAAAELHIQTITRTDEPTRPDVQLLQEF